MAMGWGSDNVALRQTTALVLAERLTSAGFSTRYYTPQVHAAAFALPQYVQDCFPR